MRTPEEITLSSFIMIEIVENIIKNKAVVARLNCTPDYEAAIVMKEYIDKIIV